MTDGNMGSRPASQSVPTELVARLEVAEAGSRELDAAIWCAVRGHTFHRLTDMDRALIYVPATGKGMKREDCYAPYTASLDAALALAERVLGRVGARIALAKVVGCSLRGDEPVGSGIAKALCIAILKASTASGVGIFAPCENETQTKATGHE